MASNNVLTNVVENEIVRGMFRTKSPVAWAASTAKALEDLVFFTSGSDLYIARVVTAGTTAASVPTWPTTLGSTVVDGTVTWRIYQVGALKAAINFSLHLIKGIWAASTVYATSDYIVPVTHNGRLYKATTGGTSGASQPTFPVTDGGTVVDGTVTWTEQTVDLEAGTFPAEPVGNAYTRVAYNPSDANWQDPSAGNGATQNNLAVTFPTPTGNWGMAGLYAANDALTGGEKRWYTVLNLPKTIETGAVVSFAIGDSDFAIG